jgi:hypothetical protein
MDMFSMSYPSTALKFVPGSVYRNLFTTNSEWEFIDATVSSKVYGFGTLPGFKVELTPYREANLGLAVAGRCPCATVMKITAAKTAAIEKPTLSPDYICFSEMQTKDHKRYFRFQYSSPE